VTVHPRKAALPTEAGAVARGSLVNVLAMAAGAVLSFALTVLASRWLQPRQAGEFFEMVALFTILSNTLGLGADTGLTRWIASTRAVGGLNDIRRIVLIALGPVLIFGVAVGAGVWLAAPELAHLLMKALPSAQGTSDIRIVAPLIPLGALSTCLIAAARGFGRMWPYLAIEGVGKPVMRIVLVVVALVGGWGLRGALAGWSLPVAVGMIASWVIFGRMIATQVPAAGRPFGAGIRGGLARPFWRFTAPRGLATVFQVTALWIGVLMVGVILNSYNAGLYSAVSRLAMIGTLALEATRLAIAPALGGLLAKREHQRAGAVYQSATGWLMLASWPLYLMFAIFPTVALGIFGHKYLAGATSLVILAGAMLVNTGTGNVTVVLLMGGKSYLNVVNTLVALTVNVGLNLILLPRVGLAGAAIAWAASIIVDNLAAVGEVWYLMGMKPVGPTYGRVILITCASFGLTGVAARLVLGQTLLAVVAALAAGCLIFVGCLFTQRVPLQLTGIIAAMRTPDGGAVRSASAADPASAAEPASTAAPASTAGRGRHRAPSGRPKPGTQDAPGQAAVTGYVPAAPISPRPRRAGTSGGPSQRSA
jgi:O-antigen/teichoic acid export membrane protein